MRYFMKFYLKGRQNYQKLKSKVPKKDLFYLVALILLLKYIFEAKSLTSGISDAPCDKTSYITTF